MKQMSRAIVAGLCAMFVLVSPVFAKSKIAVMDFDNKSQYGGYRVGQGASDMLATGLVKTGKYTVLERDKLGSVLKEQDLGQSGRIDPATAVKIGKILGVAYIVTGAVTEYGQSGGGGGGGGINIGRQGYHAAVDVRVVNATTGEIVFADTAEHSESSTNVRVFGFGGGESFNEKKASEVMRTALDKVVAKMSFTEEAKEGSAKAAGAEAMVADIDGKTVTLNQGKEAGFKVGQKVNIARKDKEIKDPETGQVIKVKFKSVGAIEITKVEANYAEGKVVSGEGFTVGDMAKSE